MKKLALTVLLITTIASLYGDDLFTENANLKKQLSKQQKELKVLQRQNQLALQLTSLKTTNKFLKGKISQSLHTPQSKPNTVIWDYKLASPQEWNRSKLFENKRYKMRELFRNDLGYCQCGA